MDPIRPISSDERDLAAVEAIRDRGPGGREGRREAPPEGSEPRRSGRGRPAAPASDEPGDRPPPPGVREPARLIDVRA